MRISSSGDLLAPISEEDGGADPYATADGDVARIAAAEDAPPRIIARYTIVHEIGRGGMGVVYLAYDPKLDRKVALKVLRGLPETLGDRSLTSGKARLLREAQALAKLSHPNVVQVFDVDIWEGALYLTMEFVPGRSLDDLLEAGPLPWRQALRIFLAAGEGLAAAHDRGIVHRDFKPGNVLVGEDGTVKVLDFGLAKRAAATEEAGEVVRLPDAEDLRTSQDAAVVDMARSASSLHLTVEGRRVGTPAYMSPEQHMGLEVGPAGDQFSFCASLWEALYGELPFEGGTFAEQTRNVLEGNLRTPPADTDVPVRLQRILARGLSVHPEDRYPDMRALLADLAHDPAKRWRRIAAIAGVVLAMGGVGGAVAHFEGAALARCEAAGGAEIEAIPLDAWSEAIHAGFSATKLPYAEEAAERVVALIRRRLDAWREAHASLCRAREAAGGEAASIFEARAACLQRTLAQTRVFAESLAEPTPGLVERAAEALVGLDSPIECLSYEPPEVARRRDAADRAQADALLSEVARAAALAAAGRTEASLETARRVVEQAQQAGFADVEARAWLYVGDAARRQGDLAAMRDAFARAAALASQADDADTVFLAYVGLAYGTSEIGGRLDAAEAYLLAAETATAAGEPSAARREILETQRGAVALARGDVEAAVAAYETAARLAEQAHGPRSPRVAVTWTNLATALVRAGRTDEARARFEAALELVEETMGARHPRAGAIVANLANLALVEGDYGTAGRLLDRAAEIFAGIDPVRHANVETVRAVVAQATGDLEAAAGHLDRAARLLEEAGQGRSLQAVVVARKRAELALRNGRFDEAAELAEQALEGVESLGDAAAAEAARLRAVACLSDRSAAPVDRARRCTAAARALEVTGKGGRTLGRVWLAAAEAADAAGDPADTRVAADAALNALRPEAVPDVRRALVLAARARLAEGEVDAATELVRSWQGKLPDRRLWDDRELREITGQLGLDAGR